MQIGWTTREVEPCGVLEDIRNTVNKVNWYNVLTARTQLVKMRCLCHQPWCSEKREEMLLRLPDQDYQKRLWSAALGVEFSAHVRSGGIAIWHFDPDDLAVLNYGSGDVSMTVGFRDGAYPKHVTRGDMEIRMKTAVLNEIRLHATVKALEKKLHEERIAHEKTTVSRG